MSDELPVIVTVTVDDLRPEIAPKRVATFPNVPREWSNAMILKRLGLAEHLHVKRDGVTIQEGRR